MHPILSYALIAIALGNALFLTSLLVISWRRGLFKKRKPTPIAALKVQHGGEIMYFKYSDGVHLAQEPECIGQLDASLGQIVMKQKQHENLSPAELASFINVEGQSFWEKFPVPTHKGPRNKKNTPIV